MNEDTTVYFKNEQWAVTDFGIELLLNVPFHYDIPKSRLRESGRGWLAHMAEKSWVDMGLFTEAFCLALEIHK